MDTPPNPALDEARKKFDEARTDDAKRITDLEDQVAALTKERDEHAARADKAERAATAARAKVTAGPAEKRPRKLGPIAEDKTLDRDELKAAIADADKVEVAFSDGEREVAGSSPVHVEGDAWRSHSLGLMLDQPVRLTAPHNGAGWTVRGYALLLDGKQVAWAERSTALHIGAGRTLNLEHDIIF
jgi:hypothetical protein